MWFQLSIISIRKQKSGECPLLNTLLKLVAVVESYSFKDNQIIARAIEPSKNQLDFCCLKKSKTEQSGSMVKA